MIKLFILAENNTDRDNLCDWIPGGMFEIRMGTQALSARMECEHYLSQKQKLVLIISDKPSNWMRTIEKATIPALVEYLDALRARFDKNALALVLLASEKPAEDMVPLLAGYLMKPIEKESYLALLARVKHSLE